MNGKTETEHSDRPQMPMWLILFCYLLIGPATGINMVFVALAVPQLAAFGFTAYAVAGIVGMFLGLPIAFWLARQIYAGISH